MPSIYIAYTDHYFQLIGLTRSVSTLEAAEKATNNGVVYLQTLVEKLVRDDELRGNLGKAHENLGKERSEVSRLNAALGEERAEVSRMKTALDEEAETRRRTECLHREANSNLYRRLASMIMTGRENAILLRQTQDRNRYSEAQLKEIQPPRDTISEREKTIQVKDQELQDLRTQKSKAEGDLREVMESKEKEIDRITSEVEGKVLKAEERVQAFQRKIREVEEKAQRAEEKVLEAEKRARDSERKTQEAKSSLHQAEERTRASESKIREAEEKVRNFERSLYQAELRVQEAEASAKAAEENAMGKSKLASPTTSVEDDSFNSQDEIHMSKKRKLNQGTPNDPRQIDFDDALSNLMDLLGSFRVIGQTKISLVFPELLDCFGKPNAKENFQAYLGIPDRSSWVCLQWVVKRGRRTPHIIMGDTHCMECTKASKRCIQVKGEAQDEEVSKTLVRVVTSNGF